MVQETVMYNSMFLLGIIVFGSFAVTFSNYSENAEDVAIDSNLEITVQRVGNLMSELINQAEEMTKNSASFVMQVPISMESSISRSAYLIRMAEIANNQIVLTINSTNGLSRIYELGFLNDSSNGLSFDGIAFLNSQSINQVIEISWDGTLLNIIFRQR